MGTREKTSDTPSEQDREGLLAVCIVYPEEDRGSAEAVREDLLDIYPEIATMVLTDTSESLVDCFARGGALVVDLKHGPWAKARLRKEIEQWLSVAEGSSQKTVAQKFLAGVREYHKIRV